jgi:hypothetical protein
VQAVAKSGMTVVAALDALSPSVYAQLDMMAVLLQGHLVYHGSTGAFAVHC